MQYLFLVQTVVTHESLDGLVADVQEVTFYVVRRIKAYYARSGRQDLRGF
jgi:hypothetical protein